MAVCRKCGCAIPIGSKTCDICATTGAIAPSAQVWQPPADQPWQPPANAAPIQLASTAASWAGAGTPGTVRSSDVAKAEKQLKWAWQAAAFVGVVNVGLGAVAELVPVPDLLRIVNWGSAIEGAIYIVLAYFIRRGSKVAVGITLALLVLDAIGVVLAGGTLSVGTPLRIFIFLAVFRGFTAIGTLRRAREAAAATAAQSQPRAA